MAGVPPASEQPSVVDVGLGVREYWPEKFRRVVVVEESKGRYVILVDLYRPGFTGSSGGVAVEVREAGVAVMHIGILDSVREMVDWGKVCRAELVVLNTSGRTEVIGAQIVVCNASRRPSVGDIERLYRSLVVEVEGRDPAEAPLEEPSPVARVYLARGLAVWRRRRGGEES